MCSEYSYAWAIPLSDSLDQNNLAHVGKAMYYLSKFQKICYGAQCIYGTTYKGIVGV
jgi:hypothetical protein